MIKNELKFSPLCRIESPEFLETESVEQINAEIDRVLDLREKSKRIPVPEPMSPVAEFEAYRDQKRACQVEAIQAEIRLRERIQPALAESTQNASRVYGELVAQRSTALEAARQRLGEAFPRFLHISAIDSARPGQYEVAQRRQSEINSVLNSDDAVFELNQRLPIVKKLSHENGVVSRANENALEVAREQLEKLHRQIVGV